MAGKAAAKAADKVKITRPDLRSLAQHLAGFRIYQVQPAPRRDIGQPTLPQGKLHLVPILCSKERLCDEKPKAHEELRVDDFVTPRGTAGVALHLNPNKLAQYGTGGFIAAVAGFDERAPKLGIAGKGGILHHHAAQTARPRLTIRK